MTVPHLSAGDPHTPIPIGIAVVESAGRYLVGTRPGDGPLAGCAEFPGGKCRAGEPPRDCAVRECLEETGLPVVPQRLLLRRAFEYPHGAVDLHFWLCRPAEPRDVREAHRQFRWVDAVALPALSFPPANAPVIALLACASCENRTDNGTIPL